MCTTPRCNPFALLLATATLMLLCGCGEDIDGHIAQAWSPAYLAALPDSVSVSGVDLHLRAGAGRDFMPISPPDGQPLVVWADLLGAASEPPAWSPDQPLFYVVHGDRMWIVDAETTQPAEDAAVLWRCWAHNGPKWGPDVLVSVVLEFGDDAGHRHRVIARGVNINRSD